MSLTAQLNKYKSELADTAARNAQHARPAAGGVARTSTPKPGSSAGSLSTNGGEKRTHDAAFASGTPAAGAERRKPGTELMTQVMNAIYYLKDKNFAVVPFDNIISYLSLPLEAQKHVPLIKIGLQRNERVDFIPKSRSGNGKDCFKYRPLHPVTNADELRNYLATYDTAQGLSVKELKDGWVDCTAEIGRLESEGHILVLRNKKDNTPKMVWADSPSYHVGTSNATPNRPKGQIDQEFRDFWNKTKLPANENDIRLELERAGLTPTSAVKEVRKVDHKKKERKRAVRRGGKTTNFHLAGVLKEYPRK